MIRIAFWKGIAFGSDHVRKTKPLTTEKYELEFREKLKLIAIFESFEFSVICSKCLPKRLFDGIILYKHEVFVWYRDWRFQYSPCSGKSDWLSSWTSFTSKFWKFSTITNSMQMSKYSCLQPKLPLKLWSFSLILMKQIKPVVTEKYEFEYQVESITNSLSGILVAPEFWKRWSKQSNWPPKPSVKV